jgi:hypothetical protein
MTLNFIAINHFLGLAPASPRLHLVSVLQNVFSSPSEARGFVPSERFLIICWYSDIQAPTLRVEHETDASLRMATPYSQTLSKDLSDKNTNLNNLNVWEE